MHTEVLFNPAYGIQNGRGSNTIPARTMGGSLRTNEGETWRIIDAQFDYVDPTQRAFFDDLLRYVEMSKDVFFDGFPDDTGRLGRDYRMIGKRTSLDPVVFAQVAAHSERLIIEQL